MAIKKDYITDFDSCTSMLFALSHYLKGQGFDGVGIAPDLPEVVGDWINAIPEEMRIQMYRWSGWAGAAPEEKFAEIDSEDISEWIIAQYPKKKYPAMMVGSSNGAAIHLAAALGIPWIPQTVLLSGRRSLHPDEMEKDIEWGKRIVSLFLPKNPDLLAFQMHDPLQDRLMVEKMGYFRVKRSRLGKVLEDFIEECLEPGGTLFTVENEYLWPIYRVGERHTFQIGGHGGLKPEEYLEGCSAIDQFLEPYDSKVNKWGLKREISEGPEAEWGFVPGLYEDVKRFAGQKQFKVRRIRFKDPEAMSPFVADLYQSWYARHNRASKCLLVESFALLEPYWSVKTASIPFWLTFNTHSSSEALKKYIMKKDGWDEIYLMLMSNGVPNAIGLTSISEWKNIIGLAKKKSDFIGVDEDKYPVDFATFIRYHDDLKQKITRRHDVSIRLSLDELDEFIQKHGEEYQVRWQ